MSATQLVRAGALLLGVWCTLSAADPLPAPLTKEFRQAGVPLSGVAILVRPLDSQKTRLSHRAGEPMNPASVMKLVTSYAALELLGPAYTWKTEVYAKGVEDGVLAGDLTLKGRGDPQLTLEGFWLMLRALKQRGLTEIKGDLVLDNSYFELPSANSNGFDNQGYRAYNTSPQALMVSYKSVAVRFIPQPDRATLRVVADPELPNVKLMSAVELRPGPCPSDWRDGIIKDVEGNGTAATVRLKGSFRAECGEKSLEFNLLGNGVFIAALFRELWSELGGTWRGKVREGAAPVGEGPFLAWESHALAEVVRDMNKWSNNVMARQLLLTLGAELGGAPGSPRKGAQVIEDWLSTKRLKFSELTIENGSGLSRNERISAQHLADLLAAAARSPAMPELMASLPVVGVDGTMKKRLKDNSLTGRAHIKTGTLDGVKAIAGYVLAKSGRRYVVVCMVNHANAGRTDGAQDTLLEWIYEKG